MNNLKQFISSLRTNVSNGTSVGKCLRMRSEDHVKNKAGSSRQSAIGVMSIAFVMVAAFGAYFAGPSIGGRNAVTQAAMHSPEPWTDAQTVTPAELAKEIGEGKNGSPPVVVYSGFRVLFEGAHVPGAVYHGPASKPEGLDDLKNWAQGIPRSTNLVVYCGCCPFNVCPNIRPAFEALRAMGFHHLRVLVLPNSFAKDWVAHGYPIEKGM